ncbi:sialic acid-binding Ig-like lectin 5 isoform X2 [Cynocephalus volans]|uniref:sialic acid-binding Ig-like lectin 5 isoform X2 n=1 Tax=Cynocephalus volans TaxID=110931 RepID=UPI002FC9C83B
MLALLLLPLLWGGSLQEKQGYELQLKKTVTVQEGLCVLVPCSFSYPWRSWYSPGQLYISWFRDSDHIYYDKPVATNNPDKAVKTETQGRFHLVGNVTTQNCSLSIRDARMEDTGTYFFRVEKGDNVKHNYIHKKLNVQVTALTEKPDIHFLEPLESGRPANLSCSLPGSCEGGQPLTFSWMGDALTLMGPRTLRSWVLNLTLRPQDHGTNLTCQVKRQGAQVSTERTVQLNVSYAPQNLTINIFFRNGTDLKILQNTPSLPILEGQALQLLCAADSNPPAELSWFQGSLVLNATPVSNTGTLYLPRVGTTEDGDFTCQARNSLGHQSVSLSLSVLYPPQLLGPSCSWEAEGLHCGCSSRAQPPPSLRWQLGEGLLEGNSSNSSFTVTSSSAGPWANSSLSLHRGLSSGLRLSCKAWNVHGAQRVTVLLLPEKSVLGAGVVPAALGGAGAMALFSLCVCLIFFCVVKVHRKQAARRQEGMDDEDPVMGSVAWGSREKPWPDSTPNQGSPTGKAPPSEEQQEHHYASLSFHEMETRKPQDQEVTSTTEYSEIKTSK